MSGKFLNHCSICFLLQHKKTVEDHTSKKAPYPLGTTGLASQLVH